MREIKREGECVCVCVCVCLGVFCGGDQFCSFFCLCACLFCVSVDFLMADNRLMRDLLCAGPTLLSCTKNDLFGVCARTLVPSGS